MELFFADVIADTIEPMTQVSGVAIEKAFPLQKIAEHQPIQHERCVPVEQATISETGNELSERILLNLELFVEILSDFVPVEGVAQSFHNASDVERLLIA